MNVPVWMLLSFSACMLHGWFYDACQLELADILILENVNKQQHFEACLHFSESKC